MKRKLSFPVSRMWQRWVRRSELDERLTPKPSSSRVSSRWKSRVKSQRKSTSRFSARTVTRSCSPSPGRTRFFTKIRAQQINGGAGPDAQDREEDEIGPEHRDGEGPGGPKQHRCHGDEIAGQQAEPDGKISDVGHRAPVLRSALRHIGRDLTGQKVLAHRSEEVDHLRVLWEKGFVLHPTGYHCDVARLNRPRLRTNMEFNRAADHPNKLCRCGLLHLHRGGLSPPTPCRFRRRTGLLKFRTTPRAARDRRCRRSGLKVAVIPIRPIAAQQAPNSVL